jgi:uncharacterized coiled-coil protein SlyX
MEATTERKRDWISILGPTALGLIVSLATTAGGAAWYFGNVNSRLNALEDRVKVQENTTVTQRDLTQRDTQQQLFQQELNLRLNRMDDKLDQVLENQGHRRNP